MQPASENEPAESTEKEVVVTGATGLVGRALQPELERRFLAVRTLSRSEGNATASRKTFLWDGEDPGTESLSGAEAVIHLAGEPIFGGLPTASRRDRIRASRIRSTRAIVERMREIDKEKRPRVFVCASAVGFYGDRGDKKLDEDSPAGAGFLADVCRDWEVEAMRAEDLGVRVVCLRIGVVISELGGALAMMRLPFAMGLGGRLGSGRQFFPWIHLEDLVGVILWALESNASGPVNAVAPEAVRNSELTRALGRALGRPTMLPVPGFVLRMALGELAGELLGSRRVLPSRLREANFAYRFPTLDSALEAAFSVDVD